MCVLLRSRKCSQKNYFKSSIDSSNLLLQICRVNMYISTVSPIPNSLSNQPLIQYLVFFVYSISILLLLRLRNGIDFRRTKVLRVKPSMSFKLFFYIPPHLKNMISLPYPTHSLNDHAATSTAATLFIIYLFSQRSCKGKGSRER